MPTHEPEKHANSYHALYAEMYKQCAEQYRYFLTWRNTVLAGYIAILGALAYSLKWTLEAPISRLLIIGATCLIGALFSTVFWILERRNRRLYAMAEIAAWQYEVTFGVTPQGYKPKTVDEAKAGVFANLDQMRRQTKPFESAPVTLWQMYARLFFDVRRFLFGRGVFLTHSIAIDFLFGPINLALSIAGLVCLGHWLTGLATDLLIIEDPRIHALLTLALICVIIPLSIGVQPRAQFCDDELKMPNT